MHSKRNLIIIAVILFALAIVLMLYAQAKYVGICAPRDWGCLDTLDSIVIVVSSLFLILSPFLLILAFLHKETFNVWFKFARIYVPISFVLVAITPSGSGGSMFIGLGEPDKGSVAWLLGVIFVITSLILIIRSHRRVKRQQTP
ncbi:MAG: hypothetical protein AB1352_00545 [Patescibacteria group bacterium]